VRRERSEIARTAEGWLYLAVILDLFLRMVIGWAMEATEDDMKNDQFGLNGFL